MTTDFTQSQEEIIVQLINAENNRNFTVNDLVLDNLSIAPDDVSGRETFNNTRTQLGVYAANNSGYTGEVAVFYNRVLLRSVFPNADAPSVRYPNSTDSYQLNDHVNLSDILDQINARHQINITAADVFDLPLPVFDGPPPYDPAWVRLEIRAGHKVFVGGINLHILPNDWSLTELTHYELDGLAYPLEAADVTLLLPHVDEITEVTTVVFPELMDKLFTADFI